MSYDTYIINLKQDTDKYERMQKRLDNVGIKYTRFDAYYGKDLSSDYDPLISSYKAFIPKSVIGCGLSHYMVCNNHFNKDKNKIALILEDDAVPLFKNKTDIDEVIKNAPKDWEIILLYTQGLTNYKDKVWDTNRYMGSTMAYLINYKGFKNRYDDNYVITTHTDFERTLTNCKVFKTPTMYFKPEFSESSTSSNVEFLKPLYDFMDNLYHDDFESDITGFTASMANRYKMLRIPCLDMELDMIGIFFSICILISLVLIIISKNKFSTIKECFIYTCVSFALALAIAKIFFHIAT